MNWRADQKVSWAKTTGLWVTAIAFGVFLLTACAPKGAKNWPFSIGPQTNSVALGDLDNDGDQDAFLANGENEVPVPDTVWLNDGTGHFQDSGQQIAEYESHSVILADMDADGNLDAITGGSAGVVIYFNNGQAVFAKGQARLTPQRDLWAYILAPAVGDVNGDGWLDVLAGGCCGAVEQWDDGRQQVHPSHDALWISDGKGHYTDSGQEFDVLGTNAVAFGDLDSDGDLDAFFANTGVDKPQADSIWLNDGHGGFMLSSQLLGEGLGKAVVLGDLDQDGDLDAVVGNYKADELWINLGGRQGRTQGEFTLAGHLGEGPRTRALSLADIDGDGDQDVLAVGEDQAVIWTNDGLARFTAGQEFSFEPQHALAMGDVNGDGSVDVFAGSVNHGILVWLNDGEGGFTKEP